MNALSLIGDAIGAVVVATGVFLLLAGSIGLLRFPDLYTRLHAVSVADAAGAAVVIVGLAISADDVATALRLILLAALVAALGPVLTQLIGGAAHAGGLTPISGRYSAPRPGAARQETRDD
ncbi:MAG: monovalent cation/H(+) antiporter subunit G [Hyphomonadaceae bacterium]